MTPSLCAFSSRSNFHLIVSSLDLFHKHLSSSECQISVVLLLKINDILDHFIHLLNQFFTDSVHIHIQFFIVLNSHFFAQFTTVGFVISPQFQQTSVGFGSLHVTILNLKLPMFFMSLVTSFSLFSISFSFFSVNSVSLNHSHSCSSLLLWFVDLVSLPMTSHCTSTTQNLEIHI